VGAENKPLAIFHYILYRNTEYLQSLPPKFWVKKKLRKNLEFRRLAHPFQVQE
jgi:hypothetical protein